MVQQWLYEQQLMNKMIQYLTSLGAPRSFYYLCEKLLPWCFIVSLITIGYGTIAGLWLAPTDYQQGDAYRIIYIHVPCAFLSLLIYMSIAFQSAIFLIWRIKVADIIAYCAAPLGAFFTLGALITGSLWGKPMWGTWWIWDARLTSELILLFLYLGYMGLYNAIPNPRSAAKMCAILAIIGAVDIPIIHYSVYWWNTLHQGATLSLTRPSIATPMLIPLLSMIIGFSFYCLGILCIRIRTQIIKRENSQQWVQALLRRSA
jgi:heme exporter protein C